MMVRCTVTIHVCSNGLTCSMEVKKSYNCTHWGTKDVFWDCHVTKYRSALLFAPVIIEIRPVSRGCVVYQYTMTVYIRSPAEPSAVIHGRLIQSYPCGWYYMHRICTFSGEKASEASLLLSAQLPPKPYLMSRSSQFNRPCYLFYVIFCNLMT